MNILVVSNSQIYRDFTFSFVHKQAAAYAKLGHRVRVIIPTALGKRDVYGERSLRPYRMGQQDGVELMHVRYLSLSNYGDKNFNDRSAIFAVSQALRKVSDDFRPDVIHAHALTTSAAVGAWLKRKYGCPLVITTHGSDTFVPFNKGLTSEIKKRADKGDVVVAVSSLLQKRLTQAGVRTATKVILNGFNLDHVRQKKKEPGCTLIQVCNLVARKKVDVTIRAFAQLKKKNADASLTLIGEGVERSNLESLCRSLGVEDSVRFLGRLSNKEVFSEMANANFFVMPSVGEGFGIVYLEAMAAGCITIGTEGEGIADLIVSGKNGILVPPNNPEAIVECITHCMDDPAGAAAMAEQGKRDVSALTWHTNAQNYITLFKELLP